MRTIFDNPKYRGKHVILAAGKVYTAKTGKKALEILGKIRKKDPEVVPEICYLPRKNKLHVV